MLVVSGVVVSPLAAAARARARSAMCWISVSRDRRAVSRSAASASTVKVFGADSAELLVPPASASDGSSSRAGAMWYEGWTAAAARAAATPLSSAPVSAPVWEAVVAASGAAADCAWVSGLAPPPQAARLASRTADRARAGLALRAGARRFKTDPSMMLWSSAVGAGEMIQCPQRHPGQHASTPVRRVWTSSRTGEDQPPGAVGSTRAVRPAYRVRAASASRSRKYRAR